MIPKLRELLSAHPFKAFSIHLADGRHFDIPSPDFVWLPPEGRGGLHIFVPETDRIVSANILLITSIDTDADAPAES